MIIFNKIQKLIRNEIIFIKFYDRSPDLRCYAQHITQKARKFKHPHLHCRQRAPVGIVLSSSGTSQLGMFDIQATTKCKYYDHIVLLYLESRRCRYRSIIFACFYLYVSVVNLIDYSDIDKMMDINNEKC